MGNMGFCSPRGGIRISPARGGICMCRPVRPAAALRPPAGGYPHPCGEHRGVRFSAPRAVHPHIRGEYIIMTSVSSTFFGSSPHPWGIPPPDGGPVSFQRFIPTPVGNTSRAPEQRFPTSVHPHARGELGFLSIGTIYMPGSSPHQWGIHPRFRPPPLPARFIPTPVGNTSLLHAVSGVIPVHPHVCGEYDLIGASARL